MQTVLNFEKLAVWTRNGRLTRQEVKSEFITFDHVGFLCSARSTHRPAQRLSLTQVGTHR